MEKPVTMLTKELEDKIFAAINDSNLHISLIRPIIKDLYTKVEQEYFAFAEKERVEYEKSLVENAKNEKGVQKK